MGWNSCDAYGTTVTEAQVKANAVAMADKLVRFGWQYIVVDIQWYAAAAAGHDYRPGESLSMAPRSAAAFLSQHAQMWRISDDFWDDWKLLKRQFELAAAWAPFTGVNNTWPDADMLPVGRLRITAKEGGGAPSRFTADEQRTMLTLWSIFRSPLIMGGELPGLDPAALTLLTNAEVIAVDQSSRAGHEIFRDGTFVAWKADAPDLNTSYVGLFNVTDVEQAFEADWSAVGIAVKDPVVRDLWKHEDIGVSRRLAVRLRPHASVLYRVTSLLSPR